jgi:hypothetical protein
MKQYTDKFIVAKRDIEIKGGDSIQKDAVGIIETELPESAIIYFIYIGQSVSLSTSEFEIINVDETGDQYPKKICNICHRLLGTENFVRNQNGVNNRHVRRPSCETCRKTLEGTPPNSHAKRERERNKPYKIPFECPICGKRTIAGVTSKIVLDHNHNTGEIRGWVCDSCNTGIGRFKDDIKLIKSAMKFLEQ